MHLNSYIYPSLFKVEINYDGAFYFRSQDVENLGKIGNWSVLPLLSGVSLIHSGCVVPYLRHIRVLKDVSRRAVDGVASVRNSSLQSLCGVHRTVMPTFACLIGAGDLESCFAKLRRLLKLIRYSHEVAWPWRLRMKCCCVKFKLYAKSRAICETLC